MTISVKRCTPGQQATPAAIPWHRTHAPIRSVGRGYGRSCALLAALVVAIGPGSVRAATVVPVTTVSGAWILPVDARRSTRAFLDITSSVDATLLAVRSPGAAVRLFDDGRELATLALPAATTVAMRRHGPHLVLGRLATPLRLGAHVPLVLVVRDDASGREQEIAVQAEVRLRSAIDDERRAHGHATGPPPAVAPPGR